MYARGRQEERGSYQRMSRGQSQVQRLLPYQLELYEAQMKNSHARVMAAPAH